VIDSLRIVNFKRFEQASLTMRPLTILTGMNGGGKSTVLQSLLLSRLASTSSGRIIRLNGPYDLSLGTAADVLNRSASESVIDVYIGETSTSSEWAYKFTVPEEADAFYLTATDVPDGLVPGISNTAGGFTYLGAERLGPRDVLAVSAQGPDDIGVGVHGEFTAQVLALRETRVVHNRRNVRPVLHHPNVDSPLLRLQAEAWASDIIRPIRITAQLAAGIMASTIRFQDVDKYADIIRPTNAGFGISYALPIIVAGLLTVPGDLLLVENPEAHLHPAGQSKLGRFLAKVAGNGVQVVVETHSDHVLNGARLAVAQENSLPASDMIVHYFDYDEIVSININDRGELDSWPAGFFDQIETDLGGLARARQRR
jgi:predicted ATPase